jgi:hypothetical protein
MKITRRGRHSDVFTLKIGQTVFDLTASQGHHTVLSDVKVVTCSHPLAGALECLRKLNKRLLVHHVCKYIH